MNEIEQEVDNAVASAALPPDAAHKCGAAESSAVVKRAMEIFVEGNPRSWWLSLKGSREHYPYDTVAFEHIRDHISADDQRCWFIPETEAEHLPVYECDVDAVVQILSRCFLFEYYIVGKKMNWLIINTDHGELVVCRRVLD
jgi:hypothetical protein